MRRIVKRAAGHARVAAGGDLGRAALFSVPAAAPDIARELGVSATLSGTFVSSVYGVGIASALLAPGFVHRYGAVRVSEIVLLAVLGFLGLAAAGSVLSLALGAAMPRLS
jgi:cyanate permease